MRVYARVPGHALGWAPIDADAARADAEVRLLPEGMLAGKVIDIQGGPVAGVKIPSPPDDMAQGRHLESPAAAGGCRHGDHR